MEQLGQLRIQLVRDDDFKSRNLALFDIACREAAESVVAAQRVAIADYENLSHWISSHKSDSLALPASAGLCSPVQARLVMPQLR
jgi:hypothetical protein